MSDDVGQRLGAIRRLHGLSQRALAKLAGVTNGLISQIEQNRISPSIGSLKKILDVLALSLADFFTGDDGTDRFFSPVGAGALDLGLRRPEKDLRVEFIHVDAAKGPRAIDVRVVE